MRFNNSNCFTIDLGCYTTVVKVLFRFCIVGYTDLKARTNSCFTEVKLVHNAAPVLCAIKALVLSAADLSKCAL